MATAGGQGLRNVVSIPLDGAAKPFLKTDQRVITQLFSGFCDVCHRMFDISAARVSINGRDVVAGNLVDLLEHRIHGDAVTTCNVEYVAGDTGCRTCQQVRFDDILHVSEVAGLKPIAINCRTVAFQNRWNEEGENAAVLRRRILPGTKNVRSEE